MSDSARSVAIITGAGSGIGRAIALRLAAADWRLAVVGRTAARLEETKALIGKAGTRPHDVLVIAADVGVPDQSRVVVDRTMRAFGRVDALVNNAACGPCKPIAETSEADLYHTFEVDLFGPTRLVAHLWSVFIRQQGGRVVNISSMATVDPFPGLSVYAMAKSGLESLTRSIHNEGAALRIEAYSIAPGAVETAMLRTIVSKEDLPTERTLAPDDVATVAVDCVLGRRPDDRGRVIELPSP